ncbi:glycosyltransferase family protein [Novosphingobium soli]|uniref:Glycosyltransferase n=1 Tax=Novosphingobium soli TaxID=574956 RepID=A0ABV6CWA6_9SPHN
MQSYFGYEIYFIASRSEGRWGKPLSYIKQARQTLNIIRREQPDIVWVQMPPTFLLHVLQMARLVSRKPMKVIADCHNRVFRAPWSKMPGLVSRLNQATVAIAHNSEVGETALRMGIDRGKLLVFETRPAQLQRPADMPPAPAVPEILVPCSYGPDEPISVVLEAARQAPHLRFLLTGKLAKAKARGFVDDAPSNVHFTGFLDKEAFEKLLFGCSAILGLTDFEGIQLSVANEAVGAGKAMVLSDTAILRDLFGEAALFARNEPAALARACSDAVERAAELDARSAALREAREIRWKAQADEVKIRVGLPV